MQRVRRGFPCSCSRPTRTTRSAHPTCGPASRRSPGSPRSGRSACARWHDELGGLEDPREELLVYQTLVGALPIERERLDAYLEKALREGKVNTSWLAPNEPHEKAVQEFAARAAELLARDPFLEQVREAGRRLALAQLLLKLTSPGVPDIYRGDELEDLSLVDPDNRRPVDWAARRAALRRLRQRAAPDRATAKLYVTWQALRLRAELPEAFAGSYEPVDAGRGVCAFVRGGEVLVAAAVRPGATVELPAGWCDLLGIEGSLAVGDLALRGSTSGVAGVPQLPAPHLKLCAWRCDALTETDRAARRPRAGAADRQLRSGHESARARCDFHHHNILRHGARHVAIDPKPYLSDREYDIFPWLRNPCVVSDDRPRADRTAHSRRSPPPGSTTGGSVCGRSSAVRT